jgi:uncharacterized RDD family membrane protein YckC
MENTDQDSSCGLVRRLAAIGYDSLLLSAVLFAATAVLLPFTGGEAIHSGNYFYLLYLIGCSYLYFAWQWTHGGQTLGMRAWKVRLQVLDSGQLDWTIASKRFLLAMLSWLFAGAGFLWALFDTDRLAFHDRYSGSGLFRV